MKTITRSLWNWLPISHMCLKDHRRSTAVIIRVTWWTKSKRWCKLAKTNSTERPSYMIYVRMRSPMWVKLKQLKICQDLKKRGNFSTRAVKAGIPLPNNNNNCNLCSKMRTLIKLNRSLIQLDCSKAPKNCKCLSKVARQSSEIPNHGKRQSRNTTQPLKITTGSSIINSSAVQPYSQNSSSLHINSCNRAS